MSVKASELHLTPTAGEEHVSLQSIESERTHTSHINNLLRNEPAAAFSHRTTHTWFEESGSVDPITSVHSRKSLEDESRPPSAARSAPEPKHKH